MKLYSPEGEGPINVDKEQSQIMFDAGWTKEKPEQDEPVSEEKASEEETETDDKKVTRVKRIIKKDGK